MTAEAMKVIFGDREQTYGHPSVNLDRIAKIWSVIFGIEVTAEQVCWAMVGLKMSREVNKSADDNIVDALGYLMLIDRVRQANAQQTTLFEEKAEVEKTVQGNESFKPTEMHAWMQLVREYVERNAEIRRMILAGFLNPDGTIK